MRGPPITEKTANAIWDILIEHVGQYVPDKPEDAHDRMSFAISAPKGDWTEWRFQGKLGFGGKIYNNAGRWYVSCYPEHRTPKRAVMIEAANAALDKLWEETYGEPPRR